MYDSIIIGCGISGMTAGIYLRRANLKTLIIDNNGFGGQIINSMDIENYPGYNNIDGFTLSKKIYDQAKNLGCDIINDEVLSLKDKNTVITKNGEYKTKTIIIANGLVKRKLGLYGETEFVGKGISYCATCDGNFFKDKIVAIVGAGNHAVEDALYLSNIANKVYFIHRNENFKCDNILKEQLYTKNNIDFKLNTNIISLNGEDKLNSITLSDDSKLIVDALFISIGNIPNNLRFSNLINLDEYGYIISNDTKTNVENIFAAGDTRTKEVRQLVTASSDGAVAAYNVIKYLN